MLDRKLNDLKAGTQDHKTEMLISVLWVLWEAAKIGMISLMVSEV